MINMFQSALTFLEGKKTYLVVAAGVVLGIVQGLDDTGVISFHIPLYTDAILGFLGLGALRSGVEKASEQATVATVQAVAYTTQSLRNSPVTAPVVVTTFPTEVQPNLPGVK